MTIDRDQPFPLEDFVWRSADHASRITLSPRAGGRVISWVHEGCELVLEPVALEGGLLRVLFAEEQYPGSSFVVPHEVVERSSDPGGFRVRLRHFWNAAAGFMRAAGWPEKASELHLDGLVLDKTFSYDAATACLACELVITNVTDATKYFTPWVHNSFAPWPAERWVVIGGERRDYADTEIYWGSHLAEPGKPMRMVHAHADGRLFAVLGAATDHLRGMCAYLPIPGEFHQSSSELRYATIELPPGHRWRSNSFLALTPDWRRWATDAPRELVSRVELDGGAADGRRGVSASLLEAWMLPEERRRGLMLLSFHDKPPFASASRFRAAHVFAGFHAEGSGAAASVSLFAPRGLRVTAALTGANPGWNLRSVNGQAANRIEIAALPNELTPLVLTASADLRGGENVAIELSLPDGERIVLRVAPGATVEPRYPYHVRQAPAYLERRYRDRLGPGDAGGADADQLLVWQRRMRGRLTRWLAAQADGPCDLEPRLLERQEGSACVREKWLIQSEPGVWVPGYLIRPRSMTGSRPVLFHLHGSGPGKDGYAGDEDPAPPRTQLGNELEHMPYRLAVALDCLVYVPDGRGQGEMGETHPATWHTRMDAMGLSNQALRLLDQVRALDWLATRPDVDAARVGSLGCSGGGGMTYWFAAADQRVAASIVSSTSAPRPLRPPPPGYFHRMFADPAERLDPSGGMPVAGPAMGMLVAPRPMWILDGTDDREVSPDRRAAWRAMMQPGRDAIRRAYDLLGAHDRFRDDWITGGHCAGLTLANAVAWFGRWFNEEPAIGHVRRGIP